MSPMNNALATWTDGSVWRLGPAAFRALRTMRATPPGAAGAGDRADVFRAALEQAQQQITAARSVGYESRPLNLFYGLSQAGRAIGAAGLPEAYPAAFQPAKGAIRAWELGSHGIDVADLDAVTPEDFPEMVIESRGKATSPGSFTRLASLLSPGCDIGTGIAMAKLWANVLESVSVPLIPDCPRVLTMDIQSWVGDEYFSAALYTGAAEREKHLKEYEAHRLLEKYPTLQDYRLHLMDDGHPPAWHRAYDESAALPVSYLAWVCWPRGADAGVDNLRLLHDTRTTDYRGRRVVLPGYSPNDKEPLHPLLTWWAILFGLSMLCRYRPVVWTDLIDINHSDYASAIEHLLDVGLDAVPDLIERTIRQVAA